MNGISFPCRKEGEGVGEEVENVAEAIKESGREEPGPDWVLREARLRFIFESQNTGLMKVIGKVPLLFKGNIPDFHGQSPKKKKKAW